MTDAFDWLWENKALVLLVQAGIVAYLLYYHESFGFLAVALILAIYAIVFYEHYSKANKAGKLLAARLDGIKESSLSLRKECSYKDVPSGIEMGAAVVMEGIDSYLALGDIGSNLTCNLPINVLIGMDTVKLKMLDMKSYLTNAQGHLEPIDMENKDTVKYLCDELIVALESLEVTKA
ncbi:MAG: hypothetical protein EPN36_05565 [Rhodanobacteraceae bacterium]|nr:MAG: hypothetical protein EPN36_05565 [Rhodanobacteraceae bacterium]